MNARSVALYHLRLFIMLSHGEKLVLQPTSELIQSSILSRSNSVSRKVIVRQQLYNYSALLMILFMHDLCCLQCKLLIM